MKKFILLLGICSNIYCLARAVTYPVNSVLGDKSFVTRFGYSPSAMTDDVLRIQTHLQYVERILEQRDVSGLSAVQRRNRIAIISHLHEYWTAGIFPSNFDFLTIRRPCFIDRKGNICAVGYLIEKTAGRRMAEEINAKHQYEYILDMDEPIVMEWAEQNGLTLEECAMIQPQYGAPLYPVTEYAEIKTGYGISSGVLSGLNVAATISNFSARSPNSRSIAHFGIASGLAQIILGAANIKSQENIFYMNGPTHTISYKSQNNLSYFNIAMGTTTVVSSVLQLVKNKKSKDPRNAFNLYSYPNYNNSLNVGLTVRRRI